MKNSIFFIIIIFIIITTAIIFLLFKTKSNIEPEKIKRKTSTILEKKEEKTIEPKLQKQLPELPSKDLEFTENKIYDENPYNQAEGIAALEVIGGEESIEKLEDLLDSLSPSTISKAIEALGRLKAKEAIPKLENLYKNSQIRIDGYGPSIRMDILDALGNIQDENAVDFLGQQFSSNESIMYKDHILDAFQKIKSKNSLPYLKEYKTYLENNPGPEDFKELRFLINNAKDKTEKIIQAIESK